MTTLKDVNTLTPCSLFSENQLVVMHTEMNNGVFRNMKKTVLHISQLFIVFNNGN